MKSGKTLCIHLRFLTRPQAGHSAAPRPTEKMTQSRLAILEGLLTVVLERITAELERRDQESG